MNEMPRESKNENPDLTETNEQYQQWMKDHPETSIASRDLQECGPFIEEMETMITSFESKHSIEALHKITELTLELNALFRNDRDMSPEEINSAINNLTPDDAQKYRIRVAARSKIAPINQLLNFIKNETDISEDKLEELAKRYESVSMAVGIINGNTIHHDRKVNIKL